MFLLSGLSIVLLSNELSQAEGKNFELTFFICFILDIWILFFNFISSTSFSRYELI